MGKGFAQPGEHTLDADRFGWLDATDIEAMHQQAEPRNGGLLQPEAGCQHLEGDAATDVAEGSAIEIEAQQLTRVLPDGTKQLVAKTGGGRQSIAD